VALNNCATNTRTNIDTIGNNFYAEMTKLSELATSRTKNRKPEIKIFHVQPNGSLYLRGVGVDKA
jgi:hypothetical protein